MNDWIVWLIIIGFYAPTHYLIPLIVVFFRESDGNLRRQKFRAAVIDCSVSMVLAFALVIWLASRNIQLAMVILLASILVPYARILLGMRAASPRSATPHRADDQYSEESSGDTGP